MKTFLVSLVLTAAVLTFVICNSLYIGGKIEELLAIAEELPADADAFEADAAAAEEKMEQLWTCLLYTSKSLQMLRGKHTHKLVVPIIPQDAADPVSYTHLNKTAIEWNSTQQTMPIKVGSKKESII